MEYLILLSCSLDPKIPLLWTRFVYVLGRDKHELGVFGIVIGNYQRLYFPQVVQNRLDRLKYKKNTIRVAHELTSLFSQF